jgi:hypothetical protein
MISREVFIQTWSISFNSQGEHERMTIYGDQQAESNLQKSTPGGISCDNICARSVGVFFIETEANQELLPRTGARKSYLKKLVYYCN